jgi:hypothetical protein
MRLTLRTLLAYLDDILDPADKEQLAKKIESSEFAEDLVHRTRDTMRRLRLSAPQVIGSGMGLDPNTVAEYLDNVLPPESVGDFERICLESDMHLAEAAACHHVLTMVLGEPADVDPVARQRMYSIPAEDEALRKVRVEPAHAAMGAVPLAAAPMQMVAAAPARVMSQATVSPSPEVPEYLRASGWGGLRTALVGLAAVALIAAGLFLMPGVREWITGAPVGTEMAADTNTEGEIAAPIVANTAPPTETVASTTPADEGNTATSTPQPTSTGTTTQDPYDFPDAAAQDSQATANTDVPPGGTETTEPIEGPPGIQESSTALIPPQPTQGVPTASGSETIPPDQSAAATDPAPAQPGDASLPTDATASATPSDTQPTTEPIGTEVPPETLIASADTGATGVAPIDGGNLPATTDASETAQPAATEEVPAGPVELGTYLGRKTVLLRYDDANGAWFRLEPRVAIMPGNRLLALPQFRPKILLSSGVSLDVSGGTQLVMQRADQEPAGSLPAADAGVPLVELIYGRIILTNTANDESQLRVKVGPASGDVRLARNATLGVEVERQYVPGNDPRKTPAPIVARFFAPDGGVRWQDAAGEKAVDTSGRWTITEGVSSEIAADPAPPDWIDHEPIGQLSEQRYAAPKIETTLVANRPADIQLLEMFQTIEQREVKSLVAKCSVHVGVFQPFIEALRDSEQKANWGTHIETLRTAMALSPESANAVKQALDEQRGRPASDDLYEMLCGYSAEQVGQTADAMKTGAVQRLIDGLEEDSLDYRVLAAHDLFEITGKRLMSNPAANQRERDQNVRNWRNRLQDGELVPGRR